MPRKINLEVETPVVAPVIKPKREITEAQREHLNKIRTLAMAKKAELKEITLKSKLAKTVPKQELAKEYDNYIAQKAVQAATNKPQTKPTAALRAEPESESDDEEVVVVHKKKEKPLEKLVYENTKDQLYQRMIEERVRNSIIGYSHSLGV